MDKLLSRSAELESKLLIYLELSTANSSNRLRASKIMCGVSFEHAESIKILIATGNFTSALALVRVQYESLVRAIWLLYAASETDIGRLLEFTKKAIGKNEKLPMQAEMLKALADKAPEYAMVSLLDFKEHQWKPLCSYIHGGSHALTRHSSGYPKILLQQVLCSSNGLLMMAAMISLILSGSTTLTGELPSLQMQFKDCLPELHPAYSEKVSRS